MFKNLAIFSSSARLLEVPTHPGVSMSEADEASAIEDGDSSVSQGSTSIESLCWADICARTL